MATGMVYGDGYRQTAARRIRLLAASLAVVLVGSAVLTPTTALAADPWMREVRFSETGEEPHVRWSWAAELSGCDVGESQVAIARGDELSVGIPYGAGFTSDPGGTQYTVCRATSPHWWLGFATGGVPAWELAGTPGSPLAEPATVRIHMTGFQWAGTPDCGVSAQAREYGSGAALDSWELLAPMQNVGGIFGFTEDVVLPAGTRALYINFSNACSLDTVAVSEIEETVGGDCLGLPGAGGDAGLVFPGGGAIFTSTHPVSGWGDEFQGDEDACLFTRSGQYRYVPPEGIDEGDTHLFAVEIGSDGGECRAVVQWGGGSQARLVINHTWTGGSGGAAGGGAFSMRSNAPPGATYINIVFTQGCLLYGLLLSNIEGDELLDNGSDGTGGPGPDLGGDAWNDCEPGADFLAVGEWVAYAACLIAGLPLAIGTIIGGILADLFVPRASFGARVQAFMDDVGGKVPFGWFGEAVGVLTAGLSASSAGPSLSFAFIGGGSLNVQPVLDDALGALAPYRGWLAAGVWFIFAQNVHFMLMSAVGSPVARSAGGKS